MAIKFIDPMAGPPATDHDQSPDHAPPSPSKPKPLTNVELEMVSLVNYPANPNPNPNSKSLSLAGIDLAEVESKLAGGGVHPSFELDYNLAMQSYVVAAKVPTHMLQVSIPKHVMEEVQAGTLIPEVLAADLSDTMLAPLRDAIEEYLAAALSKSD
jgi:hypothetical protein